MDDTKHGVTIPGWLYRNLLRSELMLVSLEGLGVDNWNGYRDAVDAYEAVAYTKGLVDHKGNKIP